MSKKILLISGHGDGDAGACATISGKTYKEAEETITMVKKLKKALHNYDVEVTVYNTNKDAYKVLCNGGKIDFTQYDYVLEVHFNACVHDLKGNGVTTGTEILLPTKHTQTNTTLEKTIVKNIASMGLRNRGIKSQQLAVINTAASQGTPAALVEICFIDDKDDMNIYLNNKAQIAQKIANAFAECWKLNKATTTTKKVMLRSAKKVNEETKIKWIAEGERVAVLEEYPSWLKVKYSGKTGYIVRSKTAMG